MMFLKFRKSYSKKIFYLKWLNRLSILDLTVTSLLLTVGSLPPAEDLKSGLYYKLRRSFSVKNINTALSLIRKKSYICKVVICIYFTIYNIPITSIRIPNHRLFLQATPLE